MSLFGSGMPAHHPNIPLCWATPLPLTTNSLQKSIKNNSTSFEMSNAHLPLYTIPYHYSFLTPSPTYALTTHIDKKPEKDINVHPTITSENPEKDMPLSLLQQSHANHTAASQLPSSPEQNNCFPHKSTSTICIAFQNLNGIPVGNNHPKNNSIQSFLRITALIFLVSQKSMLPGIRSISTRGLEAKHLNGLNHVMSPLLGISMSNLSQSHRQEVLPC